MRKLMTRWYRGVRLSLRRQDSICALGRRVSTTTAEGEIRHVYDGVQCIADLDEQGLINFRDRWYDAMTGRWLSKDPIGLSGGLNLYAFCGNDPVNKIDSLGLFSDGNKRPAAIAVLGHPHLGPSGNTYRADPLGHGANPVTGEPYDPLIHQINRRGNTTTFNLDGTPRGSGNIPKRDAAAFGKVVMDAAKYMLKVPMIIVMPPGFFLPPETI